MTGTQRRIGKKTPDRDISRKTQTGAYIDRMKTTTDGERRDQLFNYDAGSHAIHRSCKDCARIYAHKTKTSIIVGYLNCTESIALAVGLKKPCTSEPTLVFLNDL